jgi:CHAD domain-containing protein
MVRTRAAEVIEEQRQKLAANVGSAVDGKHARGVHDMRVASRRLRAALRLFEPWLDTGGAKGLARDVRRVTRALGSVREIDVMRSSLSASARRAQPIRAFAIEAVDSRLAAERRRARARMMKRFARVDLDDLDDRLRRLATELRDADAKALEAPASDGDRSASGPPTMPDLMQTVGPDVVATAHRLIDSPLPEEQGTTAAREALHQARIEAKKLRYVLEILTPTLGATGKKLVTRLRRLQDRIGDFHDDVVLDDALAEARTRATAKDRVRLAGEIGRFRTVRRRSLLADERACRRELAALRSEGFADAVAAAILPGDAAVDAGRTRAGAAGGDGGDVLGAAAGAVAAAVRGVSVDGAGGGAVGGDVGSDRTAASGEHASSPHGESR